MRSHPLAPKTQPAPAAAVPAPAPAPVRPTSDPETFFQLPYVDPVNPTLESLVALSQGGHGVPVPVGRKMTEAEVASMQQGQLPSVSLTKMERDTLLQLGWQEGEPIPPDLSQELSDAFMRYVNQKQAEGLPLEKISVRKLEDLSAEEQQRLKETMRSMIDSIKNGTASPAPVASPPPSRPASDLPESEPLTKYPEFVEKALQEADPPLPPRSEIRAPELLLPDSGQSSMVSLPVLPAKESVPVMRCNTCGCEPAKEKQKLVCFHCGTDPLEDPSLWEISKEDKRRFLISLGSRRPFEKEYLLYHNTIEVRLRSLRSREYEEISLWANRKAVAEHEQASSGLIRRISYLEMLGSVVLQTRMLRSLVKDSDLFWISPEVPYPTFKDWEAEYSITNMDELVDRFMEEVPSDAIITALQLKIIQFNQLDLRLSQEAGNTENFWQGI